MTITLCDANFVTITTQPVDANGKYLFTNLVAGTYNVKFPEATLDGKPQRNLGPINVVLAAGQNFLDADKGYIKKVITCTVTGNTIAKTCVNNISVINGSNLGSYEYVWLKSISGCPTLTSLSIAGATGQNYSLPSRPTVKTYFVRCARPIGCTTWSAINESNCITVNANECAPVINCNSVLGNTIAASCANNLPVITGKDLANYEYMWLQSTKTCPSGSSQVIAGETGKDLVLTSCVSKKTYFVRCARPKGCTSWGSINESNCITVSSDDCLPTCSERFNSNKCYRIINKKSGKAVDVYGSGMGNNCNVIQWPYQGNANQQWRFLSLGKGYFKVMARHSGRNLAAHGTSNGCNVMQFNYCSDDYKDWKVECVGKTGYYRFVHRASGRVLDVSGGSTANGANLIIYQWTGNDNQLFSIEEVASAPVQASTSATVLAMNATAESNRVRLSWMTNTGYDNDFYTVEKMNNTSGDFEKLSLVNNNQYDDQLQTHACYDTHPTEGDNFYRVKVSLNNGVDKFTEIKQVTFRRMVGFGAFPNPAIDELNVNLSEYVGNAVDIVLYNTFGKVITRTHIDNVANPVQRLEVSDFAAGQYLVRVSAEGKRDATQQVIIQK